LIGTASAAQRCPQAVSAGVALKPAVKTEETKSMNWDRIEGNWKQFTGKVREQWGKLTDDDLDVIAGKRQKLAGRIQERYGIAVDQAEREIDDWLTRH
jgi:uncharacterized protein YjbJ (UPF0337 family)